jgi:hypothetical protein
MGYDGRIQRIDDLWEMVLFRFTPGTVADRIFARLHRERQRIVKAWMAHDCAMALERSVRAAAFAYRLKQVREMAQAAMACPPVVPNLVAVHAPAISPVVVLPIPADRNAIRISRIERSGFGGKRPRQRARSSRQQFNRDWRATSAVYAVFNSREG